MTTDEQPLTAAESGNRSSTSRSLLALLRDNEATGWERLVLLYTPLVYYWCRKLDLAEQDIADVVQEVLQSVASNVRRFRKERPQDTFRGWLRTITRNKVMDHYRRQSHQPKAAGACLGEYRTPPLPEETDEDEAQAQSSLLCRALELVRGEFHERTWQAFWRVVVDGQAPADVAGELGMTSGAVRVAKCRVLHRLRQELGDVP